MTTDSDLKFYSVKRLKLFPKTAIYAEKEK